VVVQDGVPRRFLIIQKEGRMKPGKLFLPEKKYFAGKWGDGELDLLSRLIYHPVYGLIYRHRYRMAYSLMEKQDICLEIGCGYGWFLPALAKKVSRMHALDIHPHLSRVKGVLRNEGLGEIGLARGSILHLPYKDDAFSAVVCLSVLEHMNEVTRPLLEIKRVLKKNGRLIAGFPVKNRITRALFKLIDRDDHAIHPQGHKALIGNLKRYFLPKRKIVFPLNIPEDFALYFIGEFINEN